MEMWGGYGLRGVMGSGVGGYGIGIGDMGDYRMEWGCGMGGLWGGGVMMGLGLGVGLGLG